MSRATLPESKWVRHRRDLLFSWWAPVAIGAGGALSVVVGDSAAGSASTVLVFVVPVVLAALVGLLSDLYGVMQVVLVLPGSAGAFIEVYRHPPTLLWFGLALLALLMFAAGLAARCVSFYFDWPTRPDG